MAITGDKQIQEAGEGSTQLQAGTINIYNGIDEKRAREIVDERLHELLSQYSQEAHNLAIERIQEFADDFIPKLVKQGLLESFGDPSVQVLLQEAQKSAASTEREADKELLSELLIHRIQKGENRHVRAGVSQAVKIVDEISDEALLGLTVAHSVLNYLPICNNLDDGLRILANLFERVRYGDLPKGSDWLEHLETLNCTRIIALHHMKKVKEVYADLMPGLIGIGIEIGSESYNKAIDILKKAQLGINSFTDHDLRDNYVRLGIIDINRLDLVVNKGEASFRDKNGMLYKIPMEFQLNDNQKQALRDVYALYEKDENKLKENKDRFMDRWNQYESLRIVGEWWDSLNDGFKITSVGRVLAHANAKRCDARLPDLD